MGAPPRSPPVAEVPRFRGWRVVWSAFAMLTVAFGIAYSFAAFFEPFAREFDARRADVATAFGLATMLYFWLGAIGGTMSDRFGPRPVCLAGVTCLAAGLWFAAGASGLIGIYAFYGLGVGLGIALCYTPSMGAVQPWFVRRRGLASGIASSGIGAGTLLLPLAASALIAALDWRDAMRVLAVFVLLAGGLAAMGLERDPARRGTGPDGDPLRPSDDGLALPAGGRADARITEAEIPEAKIPEVRTPEAGSPNTEAVARAIRATRPASGTTGGMGVAEALRDPCFRWLYVAGAAVGAPIFVSFAHLSASARDAGIADTRAVALVGLIGVGSLVGRFGIGALADRLGRLQTHLVAQLVLGASLLLWAFVDGRGPYAGFAVFAIVFGLSYGGIVSLLPPMCSDLFGLRNVSGIIGVLYTGSGFGALAGPLAAGWLFDRGGHYGWAVALCIALSALASFSAWQVVRNAQRRPPG